MSLHRLCCCNETPVPGCLSDLSGCASSYLVNFSGVEFAEETSGGDVICPTGVVLSGSFTFTYNAGLGLYLAGAGSTCSGTNNTGKDGGQHKASITCVEDSGDYWWELQIGFQAAWSFVGVDANYEYCLVYRRPALTDCPDGGTYVYDRPNACGGFGVRPFTLISSGTVSLT